jgi:hypothetical protein
MCGYVACVPDCRGSVCCVSQLTQSRSGTKGKGNEIPLQAWTRP